LQTIPVTSPFSTWGLDLVDPFKKAKGRFTHIFVAVDKFTKWIKGKHVASITTAKAVEFIKEIMYRFGVPTGASLGPCGLCDRIGPLKILVIYMYINNKIY
jgi:hypothetical protein